MRIVFQMSAIVAALALAGCGQRGALYLPTVPPLPPKPIEHQQAQPSSDATPDADTTDTTDTAQPGQAGGALTLSPALSANGVLRTAPAGASSASDATPAQ